MRIIKLKNLCLALITATFFSSCITDEAKELNTGDYLNIASGDILVLSNSTRSVVQLSSNGQYKDTLFVAPVGSTMKTLTWDPFGKNVLVGYVYSSAVRIMKIAPISKNYSEFSSSSSLTTSLSTMIPGEGDFIYTTTSAIARKLSAQGVYKTGGGFPFNPGLGGTVSQLGLMSASRFIVCSTTSPFLKIFHNTTTEAISTAGLSTATGTTQATGCAQLGNGNIAVAWSGTTDTVSIYNPSDFSTALYTYTDTSILGSPKWLAVKSNGNLLALDSVSNLIVELNTTGEFVQTIGEGLFAGASQIVVVP